MALFSFWLARNLTCCVRPRRLSCRATRGKPGRSRLRQVWRAPATRRLRPRAGSPAPGTRARRHGRHDMGCSLLWTGDRRRPDGGCSFGAPYIEGSQYSSVLFLSLFDRSEYYFMGTLRVVIFIENWFTKILSSFQIINHSKNLGNISSLTKIIRRIKKIYYK